MTTTTKTAPSHVVFVEGQCLAYEVMMIKGKVPEAVKMSAPARA